MHTLVKQLPGQSILIQQLTVVAMVFIQVQHSMYIMLYGNEKLMHCLGITFDSLQNHIY